MSNLFMYLFLRVGMAVLLVECCRFGNVLVDLEYLGHHLLLSDCGHCPGSWLASFLPSFPLSALLSAFMQAFFPSSDTVSVSCVLALCWHFVV